MKNIINKYVLLLIPVFLIWGCSDSWLDVNDNPNNPKDASLNLLMTSAQVSMAFRLSRDMNENSSIFSRQFYNLSESQYTHNNTIYSNDFDGIHAIALKDFQEIIEQGTALERWHYVGIAKVCKAYTYMLMVDLFGDLPFDEALNGEEDLQPPYDKDSDIYVSLHGLLDEAIADLTKDDLGVDGDVIYGGSIANWVTAAKSIKLRMYVNTRLVNPDESKAAIDALIADGDIISSNSEDFEFSYGESISPLNHHPVYQQEYAASGDKTFYMDNYFMYNLIKKDDPRLNYYVYRQDDGSSLTFETYPCNTRTDCIYGYLGDHADFPNGEGDGYIGRDHGDPSGLPGDAEIRATFGVYPIGGTFDDGEMEERTNEVGTGAGLLPMISNSMVQFLLAEAAITLGTTGIDSVYFEEGIRASMSKVSVFSATTDPNAPLIDPDDIDAYVAARMAELNAVGLNDFQKLNVVIKEKYYAGFGNGIEVFTDYRRTGAPADLPTSLAPAAPFPLRLYYSVNETATNPNAVQLPIDTPIFWDK